MNTSLDESVEKYRTAGWLEELARCQISFKIDGSPTFLFNRTDNNVMGYIRARRSHFRILFRQTIANQLFQAVAGAGILGIGGWLVINRQLTLGQLVASELVILIMLAAMDKLIFMFQDWYDLLTAVEKIGHVTDLELERTGGKSIPASPQGASVVYKDVSFSYHQKRLILRNMNLDIRAGERVSLVGVSGAGKSTIANLLCGLLEPKTGLVEVNGVDVREVNLESLRDIVAVVSDSSEVFDGTIEENILVGRQSISQQDIRWALSVTQLLDEISDMPEGMNTPLVSTGRNISKGQLQRLMIARAIVTRPKLLILDEAFTGIDEFAKLTILQTLLSTDVPWTVINISHDPEVILHSTRILVLADGQIVESDSPSALSQQPDSYFGALFPDLKKRIIRREA